MYYEEKVIGGVLHFRNRPDGNWIAMSAAQITQRLIETQTELARSRANEGAWLP